MENRMVIDINDGIVSITLEHDQDLEILIRDYDTDGIHPDELHTDDEDETYLRQDGRFWEGPYFVRRAFSADNN